jgi:tetratricopeptide (TPR) repeat protein
MKLKNRDKLLEIIRSVGTIAFYQKDYFKAISRFEKLRDLVGNSYDKSYAIGLSYLKIANSEGEANKKRMYFEKSLENFNSAKQLEKDDHDVYYHVAWVLDELGRFEEAIENNKKCLLLKSDFYPAQYNIAVSLTKMGKYKDAFNELQKIPENKEVWETASVDDELEKLRNHEEFGKNVRELIDTRLGKN